MLDDLQGNILKGHGWFATIDVFICLGGDQAAQRTLVRELGAMTISAHEQLRCSDFHKTHPWGADATVRDGAAVA